MPPPMPSGVGQALPLQRSAPLQFARVTTLPTRTLVSPPSNGASTIVCVPKRTSLESLRTSITAGELLAIESLASRFANGESLESDLAGLKKKAGNGPFAANLALALRVLGEFDACNYLLQNATAANAAGNGYVLDLGALYKAALPTKVEQNYSEREVREVFDAIALGCLGY